jgi:Na+/melibiose symporter-like transporter
MKNLDRRNRLCFGLGTIGRDMFYSFEANTLLYFLSDVLSLPIWVFAAASGILSVMRIFDACNDPVTGLVIDNIRSPWGKFKPAILVGGLVSSLFFILLFAGIGSGWTFILIFAAAYLLWDISYGVNDIGYWTLLPAMTSDQKADAITALLQGVQSKQSLGLLIVMTVLPCALMFLSYILYKRHYKLDEAEYDRICDELAARKENA